MKLRKGILLLLFTMAFISLSYAQQSARSANVTFTTIDAPGAVNTSVMGINNVGQMVGYYYNDTGATATSFILNGDTFTFFSYPGSNETIAVGINDSSLISGYAYVYNGVVNVGYTYDGVTFKTLSIPGWEWTYVDGINNAGDLAGGYGNFGSNYAFVRIGAKLKDVTPPPGGWLTAVATRVNNLGEVVGLTEGSTTDGFIFWRGKFQTLTVPGAIDYTLPWGVNDNGLVVGSYEYCSQGCGFRGFVYKGGKYLSIDYPGATETFADGINNLGQVVGSYTLDNQTFHGFITTSITDADLQ